jgi:glycerol uptake facilitator-like aquaporin
VPVCHLLFHFVFFFCPQYFHEKIYNFSFFLTEILNPDITSDASSLIATAVAQGFALFVAVFMAVDVSGGHVNPAVTFAFALGGHISVPIAIFYWISQMVAASLACLLLRVASAGEVSTLITCSV